MVKISILSSKTLDDTKLNQNLKNRLKKERRWKYSIKSHLKKQQALERQLKTLLKIQLLICEWALSHFITKASKITIIIWNKEEPEKKFDPDHYKLFHLQWAHFSPHALNLPKVMWLLPLHWKWTWLTQIHLG